MKLVLGVVQSEANVVIVSGENCGIGRSHPNVVGGKNFEAESEPSLLIFADASGEIAPTGPAGRLLDRTEKMGTVKTTATIMKTPTRSRKFGRVTAYWEVFSVLISFSPSTLDYLRKKFWPTAKRLADRILLQTQVRNQLLQISPLNRHHGA